MKIEFVDVGFGYGPHKILNNMSWVFGAGESIALVGDNGAGKTTLTRLVMGLEQPRHGTVTVGGIEPVEPSRLTPMVGYVFQHPARQLFARSVREEMLFSCRQLGLEDQAATARAELLLRQIGLPDIAETHPHDLSPGEQKLMAFASSLTHGPRLLVLDEPSQGLDRIARGIMANLIREHVESGGAALTVSHDATFIAEVADRVWQLADGRIATDESIESVFQDEESARRMGLPMPPVAELANRMGWPPECRRFPAAETLVQPTMGNLNGE